MLLAALFFETSNDEECHPDSAVKQLEQMRSVLTRLAPDEREAFHRFAARLATRNAPATTGLTELATHLLD